MKKCNQQEALLIEDIIEEEYSCEMHAQNHFELIYIHYGEGVHIYNDKMVPYEKGDLFLLAPDDRHYFQVESLTRFTYIRFTNTYFESHKHLTNDDYHVVSPISLMKMQWLKEDKIAILEPCQTILKNTIENIVYYSKSKNIGYSSMVFYQILSIFGIIKEYINKTNRLWSNNTPNKGYIVSYIHENIYSKEDISVKAIAEHFNISPLYFSSYFKRNFNISYREYLEQYLLKLIKKRLQNQDLKLKEIANEFGFTDTSHLSKFFKKHEGVSPSEFKEKSTII
ncbi:MAG: AraC family transcriptional regulator [Dysgonomonas sp.]|nr:AraC family transcriptional regulator [Dysgonomonas sp.]